MIRSTRHGRRVLSLPVRTLTFHNTPSSVSPSRLRPRIQQLTQNTLLTHVCCHLQSYPSSAYSLSTSSKQPSPSAPLQPPTLLSPHPQSPPRLRLHLAHNKASIGRRRRRQYGVAASRACYPLTSVFHPKVTAHNEYSCSLALIHYSLYACKLKKKLNETIERADNAPAPTRLLHVRGW